MSIEKVFSIVIVVMSVWYMIFTFAFLKNIEERAVAKQLLGSKGNNQGVVKCDEVQRAENNNGK